MGDDRKFRAGATTYRWMVAGLVAASVTRLANLEVGVWEKLIIGVVGLGALFLFAFTIEYFIQSAIDPDVESGWGP